METSMDGRVGLRGGEGRQFDLPSVHSDFASVKSSGKGEEAGGFP